MQYEGLPCNIHGVENVCCMRGNIACDRDNGNRRLYTETTKEEHNEMN